MSDRFGQERHGTEFEGVIAQPLVPGSGEDEHRRASAAALELSKQIEPVHSRHMNVKQNTAVGDLRPLEVVLGGAALEALQHARRLSLAPG